MLGTKRCKAIKIGGRSVVRSRSAHFFLVFLTIVGLFASATDYGNTIDLGRFLNNVNFSGPAPVFTPATAPSATNAYWTESCPTGWYCPANSQNNPPSGFQSYEPDFTNTGLACVPGVNSCTGGKDPQYLPGAGGTLPAGKTTPSGNWAAEAPTVEGTAVMYQSSDPSTTPYGGFSATPGYNPALGTYVAGDTYTLDLWVGTPLTVFDGTPSNCQSLPACTISNAGKTGVIDVWFTGNDAGTGLPQTLQEIVVQAPSTPGTWEEVTLFFNPTGSEVGQDVGFEIHDASDGNNLVADFDITPAPEPGTFVLIGAGMIALAYTFRKKFAQPNS